MDRGEPVGLMTMSMDIDIDFIKMLKTGLSAGGEFADIFLERRWATSIVCEDDRIEKIVTGLDMGIGIRIIRTFRSAYAYTNDLSPVSIHETARSASLALRGEGRNIVLDLTKRHSPRICTPARPVSQVPFQEKLQVVEVANKAARGYDRRIRQVRVIYSDIIQDVFMANSEGNLAEDHRESLIFAVHAIAADQKVLETAYEPVGGCMGFELFEEKRPEGVANLAASRAIKMLQAPRAPGGRMPVVISREAGGTMIHEAIGHGLEADAALEGLSVYSGRLGYPIASNLISVYDNATLPNHRGSFTFDDEGTPAQKTTLMEKGVLKSFLYDRLRAQKSGVCSTGNGRRQSYRFQPICRMTNTYIAPGSNDPEEILRDTWRGLYVVRMGGGQVNTVNGDFVFEVSEGYLIERGKVGEALRGATLTGNGPRILLEIDRVGNDLGFSIGTCGKGGQAVPVSDGQPTLRIPDIVVGGQIGN